MEPTFTAAAGWLAAADRHIRWGRSKVGPDWLTVGGPLYGTNASRGKVG